MVNGRFMGKLSDFAFDLADMKISNLLRVLVLAGLASVLPGCISVSTVKKEPTVTTTESTTVQRPGSATETTTTRSY